MPHLTELESVFISHLQRCSPAGAANSMRHPRIPTGFRPKAQGCEARATLGQRPQKNSQPQRGCGHSVSLPHARCESARGLAHSKTLRAVRGSSANAPASWSAVTLHRFFPIASPQPKAHPQLRQERNLCSTPTQTNLQPRPAFISFRRGGRGEICRS